MNEFDSRDPGRELGPTEEPRPVKQPRRMWILRTAPLLLVLALIGAGGLLVAASGVIPIKASSGHWSITEWFLQLGKRRSVSTHTLFMEEPDLSAPWLALKGAGHYESGCRPCHGGPDAPTPRIAAAMTPLPPFLPPRIDEWEPKELFYIVKHGIKFTGMPAWRSLERDDEVRAVVAFLLEMPDLDADEYRNLVYGEEPAERAVVPLEDIPPPPPPPPGPVTTSCARCHGLDGLGRGSAAFPMLAGQRRDYLFASLQAYAEGDRHSGIMEPVAAGLSETERRAVAEYYASLPHGAPGAALENAPHGGDASAERGRVIATLGIPDRGVPSCADCHGPGSSPRNARYPNLAGQYADYLVLQLELFNREQRVGTEYARIMHHVVHELTAREMRDVALFYATTAPDSSALAASAPNSVAPAAEPPEP